MIYLYGVIFVLLVGCGKGNTSSGELIEQFFKSQGVVTFKTTDENLKNGFALNNADGSVFCKVFPMENKITMGSKTYVLSDYERSKEKYSKMYNFSPRLFYPQTGFLFQFELKDLKGNRAEVFINTDKTVTKYIKADTSVFNIQSWTQHMLSAIIDFNHQKNPIREQPFDAAKVVDLEENDDLAFSVIRIKDEWIQIECTSFCDVSCPKKPIRGWIKWKGKANVLIRFIYSC